MDIVLTFLSMVIVLKWWFDIAEKRDRAWPMIAGMLLATAISMIPAWSCKSKYSGMGDVSWGPIKGCQITIGQIKFPAEQYRISNK